jgi:hypothetical protein
MTHNWILRRALCTHPIDQNPFDKVFCVLQVYMDDSGSHETSHNCVVGGYWGSVNHWRNFSREWDQIIAAEGLKEFKSKTF